MLRLVCFLIASLFCSTFARAQGSAAEYAAEFQKGIQFLTAGKNDAGIAAFKRCMTLMPSDPTAPYNVACGFSRKNELDSAFEYLNKAADLGFGNGKDLNGASNIDAMAKDTDLASLRADPRYAALVERMKTMLAAREGAKKKGAEFAAQPAVYIPEKVAALAEMPLLVVCHDAGGTKDQVIAGRWKAIADELGMALVAPSGTIPQGADPSSGMTWYDDVAAYVKSPWLFTKSINSGVSAFMKEHKVDRKRVVIAGEGIGGSIATQVGFDSPGLYKAVVGINGGLPMQVISNKAASAGKMGLKVKLLTNAAAMKNEVGSGDDYKKTVAEWKQSLEGWAIAGGVAELTADPKDDQAFAKAIVDAVNGLLASATPVDAAATKPADAGSTPK
jgi:poly(3-hydroxybutyrate) depolymerase